MNAAVTGGTGFLGRALVRELIRRGGAVRVLVRRSSDQADIRALGAEPVAGDLSRPGACDGLVRPQAVMFHAAAHVGMTGGWPTFRKVTVDGTRYLLAQVLPQRPQRFVYVSSAVVYGTESEGSPMCAERTPARPARYNFYARAKLEAERLVRAECDRANCPWTIVRLGFLHGPGNRALARHMQRLADRRHLFIIGRGDNRIASAYVDDAARAVALAGEHPAAAGRIYDVASDETVTQAAFLQASAQAFGLPPPCRHLPRNLAYALACVADVVARIPGFEPPFSRAMVTLMSADQVVDASRIRQELGWRPEVSFAEGVRRTRDWYRASQAGPSDGAAGLSTLASKRRSA